MNIPTTSTENWHKARRLAQDLIERAFTSGNQDEESIRRFICEEHKSELVKFMREIESPAWEDVITNRLSYEQIRLADSGIRGVAFTFSMIVNSILASHFATELINLDEEISSWIETYATEMVDSFPFKCESDSRLMQ